jgi:serine/threonine protein kinase
LLTERGLDLRHGLQLVKKGISMAIDTQKKTLRSVGNWDLFEKIADRGMGTLYKASNHGSGMVATVKVMPPFRAGKEQAYQRFARECRILSALKDPHIIGALDFGIEGSEPYLVMEFVEGESLEERVARTGPMPEAEAVRLITQAAAALGRAHSRGLVHRNVKPDSILITADGQAKLTDLCLIKEVETNGDLTRDGTSLGTPNFMAPEQFRNAGKATPRCDIYSLGATLYMAVTGEPPFAGSHLVEMWDRKLRNDLLKPKKLVPTLSQRTDRAIRRAMNAQPDQRPGTCEEFVESLTGGVETLLDAVEDETDQTADCSPPVPVPASATRCSAARCTAPASASRQVATPPSSPVARIAPAEKSEVVGSDWMWHAAITLVAFLVGFFLVSRLVHFG